MEIRKDENSEKKNLLLGFLTRSIKLPLIGILFVVVIIFIGSAFFLSKYPNSLSILGITLNEQLKLQKENEGTLEAVGKLMDLPSDEQPTIATVTDVESVVNQPFFKNAQNGDVVLIYRNAQKAILYRPKEKRIIEVGAVNINDQDQVHIQEEETEEMTEEITPTPEEEQIVTPAPTEALLEEDE